MKVLEQFPHVKQYPGKEVGIEVEMEGRGCDPRFMNPINLWKITEDGSLRGEACEFVLKGPASRKDVPKVLKTLSEYIKNNNITVNDSDRCGVHIHINVQDVTVQQCLNFILLYLVFENLLVKYCGEEREGNLFCLRAGDADMLLYQLNKCKTSENLQYLQSDQYRYASINISSLNKYGSLEFRPLKTPQDVLKIQTWVDMLLCVKDAAMAIEDSRDIVESFSKNGEYAFLNKVFGKYTDLLSFPDYKDMMIEGVRRVQDIAYVKAQTKADKEEVLKKIAEQVRFRPRVRLAVEADDPAQPAPPNRGPQFVWDPHLGRNVRAPLPMPNDVWNWGNAAQPAAVEVFENEEDDVIQFEEDPDDGGM